MVSISRKRIKRSSAASLRDRSKVYKNREKLGAVVLACVGTLYLVWSVVISSMSGSSSNSGSSLYSAGHAGGLRHEDSHGRPHPHLHFSSPQDDANSELYNAMAADILQTLNCHELLNKTTQDYESSAEFNPNPDQDAQQAMSSRRQRQRRLQEADLLAADYAADAAAADNAAEAAADNAAMMNAFDDYAMGQQNYNMNAVDVTPTAAHLFCLAAMGSGASSPQEANYNNVEHWKDKIHCDATHSREQALLELWSMARSEFQPFEILLSTLKVATEQERTLVGTTLYLWAPLEDDGLEYMLNILNNEEQRNANQGIYGLARNLGPNKVFVDVGSCLGLDSMAVSLLYPGTEIVSIEAAAPNWLLQELNWRCNNNDLLSSASADNVHVILAGVGPHEHGGNRMAKFLWRPQATTSTRSWTPAKERRDNDIELVVKLRPWHSILAEAGIVSTITSKDTKDKNNNNKRIDVLNVDCEGCEYNLIPALSDDEFNAISTVMGGVHWGYMPADKLPSSKRGRLTHQRLCQHENFARTVKECCAFPDLAVLSSVPGEVLVDAPGDSKDGAAAAAAFPPKSVTVKDIIASDLCNDFDTWAAEHHLNDIESDWGWFELTSMANE